MKSNDGTLMQNRVENRMGRITGRCLTEGNGLSQSKSLMNFCVALSAVVLAAPSAYAVDGVAEINHACAVQTGCFSGDTAGYPVTLDGSAGGSYRLTSNLVIPDLGTDGIRIAAPSLTIDLNGFEIVGSACVLALDICRPTSGTGTGAGSGILRMNDGFRGTTVKNGSITGMGFWGVRLGRQSEVRGVRVRWNRVDGIMVGSASVVSGNTSYENGVHGIFAGSGSTVSNNTSFGNVRNGISSINASTIEGNSVMENGDDGIYVNSGSTVTGNTAYNNTGDGIKTNFGATVRGNTARNNDGYGLNLGSESAYRENVITGNTAGTVNGGVNMLSNSCNGATTCP